MLKALRFTGEWPAVAACSSLYNRRKKQQLFVGAGQKYDKKGPKGENRGRGGNMRGRDGTNASVWPDSLIHHQRTHLFAERDREEEKTDTHTLWRYIHTHLYQKETGYESGNKLHFLGLLGGSENSV
eukprot:gb/GECG01010515.1/.p1 GENE.gb/GECG01010515.1/~~gb/GECG01010515.1/.p1  ORF type:complete len:127 (+),score=6.48 gb/GECG01010515.1/:1-381(+)